MQIGFVGLGRMGGNMVHRIHRDSDHEVVAFDPTRRPSRRRRGTARSRRRPLADLVKKLEPPRTVWIMVPAGEPTQATVDKLAEAARQGRHDRRRRQLEVDRRQARAPRSSRKLGIHYVDVGTSGGVWGLEVGYCMMVGGPQKAVKRLSPILDVLAPPPTEEHGPGWGHLGPTGAGHYVKMVHNGIEYGLMQAYAEGFDIFDKSEYDLDNAKIAHLWMQGSVVRSWLCELAARVRAGGQRPRRPQPRTPRTPARAAGRSRTRSTRTCRRRSSPARCYARFYTRRQRRLHRPGARGAAQPVRRTRHAAAGRRVTTSTVTDENPLAEGLERLPVHPTTLVIFGATGDLARRKLLPALYNLAHEGALPERFNLVGVSRSDMPDEDYRDSRARGDHGVLAPPARRRRCSTRCSPTSATSRARSTDAGLRAACAGRSTSSTRRPAARSTAPSTSRPRPEFFPVIVEQLGEHGPATTTRAPTCGSIIEKPFGTTLEPRRSELNRHGAVGLLARSRSSASTTTWARRPSRTCWRSASPTGCSSRSGTATTSTTSRSRRPRTSASAAAPGYYDNVGRAARPRAEPHAPAAHAAVRWSRRSTSPPTRCATRRSRCCTRSRAPTEEDVDASPCARSTRAGTARRRGGAGLPRGGGRPAGLQHRDVRRAAPGGRRTGAGRASRSTCAPASGWRARSPRSR